MSFNPKFYNLPASEESVTQAVYDGSKCFWRGMGANLNLTKDSGKKATTVSYNSFQDLPDGEKCKQIRLKKIMGILNNVTRDKVDVLFNKLECDNEDESYCQLLAETLFIKVLTDEPFVHHYAAMYNKIVSSVSPKNLKCFKEVLVSLCQTGIKSLFNFNDHFIKVIGDIKMYSVKRRLMTMMRFIGELACVSLPLFERDYIWSTAESLLFKGEELHLEAAYYLLFICLLRSTDNNWPQMIEKEVENISTGESSKGKVSQRLKFLFLNLHEEKNGVGTGMSPYGDKHLMDTYFKDLSTLGVKESLTAVNEQPNPVTSLKVIVLSVNDCGTIQKDSSKSLTSQIELLTKLVKSFKISIQNLPSATLVSFVDLFSYDWFMLNVNKNTTAEERYICIDIDKYEETRFISILIDCNFIRGVELFARSNLELLKSINDCNKGLFTDSWKIVEKSAKSVLDLCYLKITCLIDSYSLTILNSMKCSLKIESDDARVLVNDLPALYLSDNSVNSNVDKNAVIKSQMDTDKVATIIKNRRFRMDSNELDSGKSDIKCNTVFCKGKEKHCLQSGRNKVSKDCTKLKWKLKYYQNDLPVKFVEKSKCKVYKQESTPQNKTANVNESLRKHLMNSETLPSSVFNSKKIEAKPLHGYKDSSVKYKQSFRHRFKPDHSNWRNRKGSDHVKRAEGDTSYQGSSSKTKCMRAANRQDWNFAKNLVASSTVSFDNSKSDKQYSDREEEVNNITVSSPNHFSQKLNEKKESYQPKAKSLSELMSISMKARNIQPKDIQQRSLGESSKVNETTQPRLSNKSFLKYCDKLIIRGIFPDCSAKEDNEIMELLEEWNEKLCISEYLVLCRFDQDNFAQLSFTVDENSLKLLLEKDLIVSFNNKTLQLQKLTSWSQAMDFNSPI